MSSWLAGTPFEVIPGATVAALVAGALLPLLGMWVVLQRVVFLGVTLAQVAAAGVAIGLFFHGPPLLCGFLACLALVALFTRAGGGLSGLGATGDSTLGAAWCAASALSLLFVSRSPVELDQVHHVLHGNLIYADPTDVWTVSAALVGGLLVVGAAFRPILFSCFDPEAAAALGLATRRWILLLFGVLAVVLSLSTRTTGSLLTFALLVLPPLAALELRRGLLASFALASALGLAGTAAGLLAAVRLDLHVESSITVAVFALYPLARVWRVHPLLALALAGALVWLGDAAARATRPHAPDHAQFAAERHAPEAAHAITVALSDARLDGGELVVRWFLDVHPGAHDVSPPPALWLLLRAGETVHEVPLVEDGAELSRRLLRRGTTRFAVTGEPDAVSGLLWTGPTSSLQAGPVPGARVTGCAVR